MTVMRKSVAPVALLLGLAFTGAGSVSAQNAPLEVGTLQCSLDGSSGNIFGGSRDVQCDFTSAVTNGDRVKYEGTISNVGINLGSHKVTSLSWTVLAPVGAQAESALGGTYVGTAVSGALGVGAGGNLLFNVSGGAATLQPLSVQFQTGFNASVSAVELQLSRVLSEEEISQLKTNEDW